MRLIDADAYKAEMKTRQDACIEWLDKAKVSWNEEECARAEEALATFIEAKLTLDNMPTIEAETVNNGRKSRIVTNADNLRSISNMQLAIFMDSVNACPYDRDDALFECEKWNGACDRCWLYWLKQKVEDEVEE